ncbi:ATP-binding protein [Phenylobacterium aquaticum]|uniref:ATP-binding protein n=1 Tax=Phenylobacterium aquaticum TaxID=1763816 RepID=UPI0026E9856F|nr:ATP-binding protein [Phenylobacterium aquaticum]
MTKAPGELDSIPEGEIATAYVPVVRGYLIAATCYYCFIGVAHWFYETGAVLAYLDGLAVLAAVSAFAFWRHLARTAVSLVRLEVAAASINTLFLMNVVAYLTFHFEPLKLVYFVLMALVFGTSAPSRRVAYGSVAAAVTGFLMLARNAPGDLISQYAFVGVAGVFASIGMSTLMRGAVLRELRARLASDALNRQLHEKLEENERLHAEAQDLVITAQAANRAKTEFLATISHEIRTPLNGVLGMAQAMAQDNLPEVQRGRLALVQTSARTLLDVVNDVLDISKIEAGKMELLPATFSFDRFAEAMRRLYGSLAQERGLDFAFEVEPGAAGWRRGDEVRLRQVLSNLISNALKFTDHGSIQVLVTGDAAGICVDVTDTGVGIPLERQAQIFEKFVQADSSSTRRVGGTGLGLAICREVVALMGGAIAFDSAPGVGTRFSFQIPLIAVAPPAEAETDHASVIGSEAELKVLVVDDNSTNRTVLQTLLGHLGVASEAVRDGVEAVEAWGLGGWDVILMDIHMPEMDGLDASRLIRARETETGRPRTPIVAVTASVLAHETEGYFAAGMDHVIAKPIEVQRLLEVIELCLTPAPTASLAASA